MKHVFAALPQLERYLQLLPGGSTTGGPYGLSLLSNHLGVGDRQVIILDDGRQQGVVVKIFRAVDPGAEEVRPTAGILQNKRSLQQQEFTTHLVLPVTHAVSGGTLDITPYVEGTPLIARARFNSLLGLQNLKPTSIALAFCRHLKSLSDEANSPVATGVVHNDLGPANVLCRGNDYYLIDWDLCREGPIIDNFFEAMFNFGSFLARSGTKQRKPEHFVAVYTSEDAWCRNLWALAGKWLLENFDADICKTFNIGAALHEFLDRSTGLQDRRTAGESLIGSRWNRIAAHESEMVIALRQKWQFIFKN